MNALMGRETGWCRVGGHSGCDQRGSACYASAKVASPEVLGLLLLSEPVRDADDTLVEYINVFTEEAGQGIQPFFFWCEQVDQQCCKTSLTQRSSHALCVGNALVVLDAVWAQYNPTSIFRNAQTALEEERPRRNTYKAISAIAW